MSKGNTVDLRDLEQTCNRRHAMQFAAIKGYEMFMFGSTSEPCEVDNDLKNESVADNPLFTYKEKKVLLFNRSRELLDVAVRSLHEYACHLEIDHERTKAFAVFEAARIAPHANY